MTITTTWHRRLLAALVLCAGGCATILDSTIDRAAARTGEGIGDAVGKKTGEMAGAYVAASFPATWTVDLTNLYVSYLFGLAMHSGSYAVGGKPYQPGEWTKWHMVDSNTETKPDTVERAFLQKQGDGKEWWRVKLIDGDSSDEMVLEGLFTGDGVELLRLRGRMPKEKEAKEMPVHKGTVGYVKPTELTEESLKGATVGREKISVPAGSYDAQHLRYGALGGGTLDWWLVEALPGGLAQYSRSEPTGESGSGAAGSGSSGAGPNTRSWALRLAASGTGAKSELGSF